MNRIQDKGLWIAVFGPDGVGKSSVIDQVECLLGPVYQRSSRFHFRPRFRRSCEAAPPVTAPHAKPARGTIVSLFKLVYWLADCWWGYLSVILPRKHSGQLIMFDRYVPDILVDPVRYRLPVGSMNFAAQVLKLAPQPDLYVLLDGSAELIHQRKRELPVAESHRQRIEYLKMFESLPCKLLVDATPPVAEVSRQVAAGICCMRSEFLNQPRERSFLTSL